MSTEFFNDQWRIPSNENQNKISNYSMEFDGSGSDVIDIGSQAFNPDHSISFWINSVVSGPNSYGGILAGGANSISIDQGGGVIGVGKIYFRISSVNYTVSSTIVSETWNHVVFTRNGTNVKCYINGVLDKTTTVPVYSTWQYIGAQLASGNNPFNGKLDQLTIFNYELSQDQVTQLGAAEGYAFNFNGTNDSIQIPTNSNLEITGNMTISAWIKSSSSSTGSTKIINKRNASSTNFDFFLDTGGTKLKFFDGTDNIASDISITLGVWNHVAITIQSGVTNGSIFYVNGVAQATNLPTFTIASNTAPLVVGASFGRNSAFFNGEISNVSIFNSSLSASNIITLYNNGSPAADISSLSPVGWWKLNAQDTFDGTNWTIKDYAGSSDGASLNMNASSLVLTNINGELVANPMAISPKPIAYYQLGDQSVSTGPTADYLVPNNSLQDYVFDVSSDKVTIPSYALTQNATVSFWVNFDSIPDDVVLGGVYGDRYPLIKSYLGNFQILISAPGQNTFFTTNTALVINTWYHIAISQNSSSATLYINGEVPSSGGTGNPATPTLTIIGGFSSGNPNLDGQLSNVSIFNSTLPATGTESIASLYNNGSPPADISSYSGLQRWYKLNAEDVFAYPNWIIIDSAGSNNGASVGMTSANLVQSNLQLGVGYSPYALELDGASNYFSCGSELGNSLGNAVTNFTLSGWYTAQGGASNEGLFGLSDASGNNKFSLVQSNYPGELFFLIMVRYKDLLIMILEINGQTL
jgi:hypothetical protein